MTFHSMVDYLLTRYLGTHESATSSAQVPDKDVHLISQREWASTDRIRST